MSEATIMEIDNNGVEENAIQQPEEAASENGCEVHDNDSLHGQSFREWKKHTNGIAIEDGGCINRMTFTYTPCFQH